MTDTPKPKPQRYTPPPAPADKRATPDSQHDKPEEIGGPSGPEPTRYGDWERKGRCVDF